MKTLNELLTLEENQALDFSDLSVILGGRVSNLKIKLSDLEEFGSSYTMKDIIPPGYNAGLCLLTAHIRHDVLRHWVTFLKHKNGSVSFYDPLALGAAKLSSYMHDRGYFSRFVRENRCDQNTKIHQASSSLIKTCGLHACSRMIFHAMYDGNNRAYHHYITSVPMKPDRTVTLLCFVGHLSVTK